MTMFDKDNKRMDQSGESKTGNGDRMTVSAAYDLLYHDPPESFANHWIPVAVQYVLASLRSTK